ncbi:MAG: rod-binding protein [Rickettsiales bacterium]
MSLAIGGDLLVSEAGIAAYQKGLVAKNTLTGSINNDASKNASEQKIDALARDFEAVFISQMMDKMFGESIGTDAFGSKESDEIYKGLMVQEYGKLIVKSGGIGIADYVKRELLHLQEV